MPNFSNPSRSVQTRQAQRANAVHLGPLHSRRSFSLTVIVLMALVVIAFSPTLHCGFVSDDVMFVSGNQWVGMGLSLLGVKWTFTTLHAGYWMPLTWLSLMVDAQIWGLDPFGFHLTNVLLHAVNAVLLFLFLRRATVAFWRSAAVALLFAVHPLRVESVAWVAERKDVLSGLFGLLALLAYERYARTPLKWDFLGRLGLYVTVVAMFVLSLMAKPMLVTLPFLLLLLDVWPLRRFALGGIIPTDTNDAAAAAQPKRAKQAEIEESPLWIFAEKLPLLTISAAFSVVTVIAQRQAAALLPLEKQPLAGRLANAAVSYVRYLGKLFWFRNLAVFYPQPAAWPAWQVTGSMLLLTGLTLLVLVRVRRQPALAVGWFWFVGTLFPVSGVVQAGYQAMADRFTYWPGIGLLIALVWAWPAGFSQGRGRKNFGFGISDLGFEDPRSPIPNPRFFRGRAWRVGLTSAMAIVLATLAVATFNYCRLWRDDQTLLAHADQVTTSNFFAELNLGVERAKSGDLAGAMALYQRALQANPRFAAAYVEMGLADRARNDHAAAIADFEHALAVQPHFEPAHFQLGLEMAQAGQHDQALEQYQQALALSPEDGDAANSLGNELARRGQWDAAAAAFTRALAAKPVFPEAHYNLGLVMEQRGQLDDAIGQYRQAIAADPGYARAYFHLGRALAQAGHTTEAIANLRTALRLDPNLTAAAAELEALTNTGPAPAPGFPAPPAPPGR